jgi:hypothetical protein
MQAKSAPPDPPASSEALQQGYCSCRQLTPRPLRALLPPCLPFHPPNLITGFGWDSCRKGGWYGRLQEQVNKMAEAGISHLWLPPPSRSVSPEGYMPGQVRGMGVCCDQGGMWAGKGVGVGCTAG